MRTCKRCNAALGDHVSKCQMCGQLNPTLVHKIATTLAVLVVGVPVFLVLLTL